MARQQERSSLARCAKPQLVFADALNNDVEIVEGSDRCLIYDEPLAEAGLTWRALVKWWGRKTGAAVTHGNERAVAVAHASDEVLDAQRARAPGGSTVRGRASFG
jgi:hypothetical protein